MRPLLLLPLLTALAPGQNLEATGFAGYGAFGNNPAGYLGFFSDNVPANPVNFHGGSLFGMRFAYNQSRWLGHEIGMLYQRNKLDYEVGIPEIMTIVFDVRRSTLMGVYDALIYGTSEESKYRPYLAIGGQVASFRMRDKADRLGRQESTEVGLNYGAGLKVSVGGSWLVRFDYREYAMPKPLDLIGQEGWMRLREVSAGAGFRF